MRRLAPFITPYWPHLAAGLACLVLVTVLQLFVPRYVGVTIDAIIRTRRIAVLNGAGLVLLVVFAARSVLLYGQIFFGQLLSHRVTADLRQRVFEQIQRWSLQGMARWTSGDLIARSLQDTGMVQTTVLTGMLDTIATGLTLAGIVVMLFLLQWRLAGFTLLILPLLLLSARLFGHEIQRISQRAQERVGDLAMLFRQAVGGARIIRVFAQEEQEIGRFRRQNERSFRDNLRIGQLIATQVPVVSFLTAAGVVAVLWLGGRLVTADVITAGTLVAFLTYVALAVEPAVGLTRHYGLIRQGLGALDRVLEILRTRETVGEQPHAVPLPRVSGAVAFEDVSFAYVPGEWVLQHLTVRIEPGERVALIGPSGAGKSTFVNLIPRFYDPSAGRVAIDGHDLRDVTLQSLRRQIGLVPQETVLFVGTVRDNIAYGHPGATDEQVVAAARSANAEEFIRALPNGFDSLLGEDGGELSGGQRQRLAIARAILGDPRIIILDEATSALDAESERLIQEALDRLAAGRTTFVIAHRLATVRKADRIIVLEAGCVVEMGRHEQLMAAGGVYAHLASLQLLSVAGEPGH